MLAKGFLASNSIYVSVAHSEKILKLYFENLNSIFRKISLCELGTFNIDDLLHGEICHSGFKRLN